MNRLLVLAALASVSFLSPAQAQPVLHARTAADLAGLCETKQTESPLTAARINFCTGYAQATLDAHSNQQAEKKSYCIKSPSPSRESTMREFAAWVRATPAVASTNAQAALIRFMTQRFPCT